MNRVLSTLIPLALLILAVAVLVYESGVTRTTGKATSPVARLYPGEYRGMKPERFSWLMDKRSGDFLDPITHEPLDPAEDAE